MINVKLTFFQKALKCLILYIFVLPHGLGQFFLNPHTRGKKTTFWINHAHSELLPNHPKVATHQTGFPSLSVKKKKHPKQADNKFPASFEVRKSLKSCHLVSVESVLKAGPFM